MLRISPPNNTSPQQLEMSNISFASSKPKAEISPTSASEKKHSENRIREQVERYRMVQHIEKLLLERKCRPIPAKGGDTMLSTFKTAQALEKHLFQKAPSLHVHLDRRTLDTRLRSILKALVQRKIQLTKRKSSRQDVLRDTLGLAEYARLQKLVSEIKTLQARYCAHVGKTKTLQKIEPQQRLPLAVQDLFFRTRLVNAIAKLPLEQIPHAPWRPWMDQAQQHLQAYREWLWKSACESSLMTTKTTTTNRKKYY